MSPSVKDMVQRFDFISKCVHENHGGSHDSKVIASSILTLASVIRDSTFSDNSDLVKAIDSLSLNSR